MAQIRILDKNGTLIQQGARLLVRHCIGPHGSTQDDIGVVERLDLDVRGVSLKLERASRRVFKGTVTYMQPGELRYIALPGEFRPGADGASEFLCHRVHQHVEHGHTAFAELLQAPVEAQAEMSRQDEIQALLAAYGLRMEHSLSALDGSGHAIVEIASGELVEDPIPEVIALAEEWTLLEGGAPD